MRHFSPAGVARAKRAVRPYLTLSFENLENRQLLAATIWYEGFDGLNFGPPVEETAPGENVWTNVPPAGWNKDDTGVPGYNNPNDNNGVKEWIGWTFPKFDWWPTVDNQTRSQFTRASGGIMVADPDEWDDQNHPAKTAGFPADMLYNARITSPSIPFGTADKSTLVLELDSSWRPEGFDDGARVNNQTGIIEAVYSDGTVAEVLHFDSDPLGQFFHPDSQNEHVVIPLTDVPAAATSVQLRFHLDKAANDWWWAVDNIALRGTLNVPGLRLVGVTSSGAGGPVADDESLWNINYAAGPFGATKIVKAASIPDGDAIGFNPATGLLHHTSGASSSSNDPADPNYRDNHFMETVDVVGGNNTAVTVFNANSEQFGPAGPRPSWVLPAQRRTNAQTGDEFNARGPNEYSLARDLTWSPAHNAFFLLDAGGIYRLSADGQTSTFLANPNIGELGGIAIADVGGRSQLLVSGSNGSDLYRINPDTGEAVGDPIFIADPDSNGLPGILGLVSNPSTGDLLAIAKDSDNPATRHLVRIDLTTNVATRLGTFDRQMSDLAFVYQAAAPARVSEVYVRGSTWGSAFKTYMEGQALGDDVLGYRVDDKPGNDVIPWVNVDEIVLRYSSAPTGSGIPTPGTVTVDGVRSDYTVSSVTALDPTTYVLRLDRVLGSLPTGGENGDRITISGPGGPGGAAFNQRINVVQGDVDKSTSVVAADFSDVKARFFRTTTAPGPAGPTQYNVFRDVDASGGILANDFSLVKGRFFDNLPPAPTLSAPAADASITADLLRA